MKRFVFALAFLLLGSSVYAQAHYCDTTQATSGTAIVGATLTVSACNDGKDSTGTVPDVPTSWKLYDNNIGVPIPMTKGTTSAVSGKTVYTGSYIVPPSPGIHALQTTALNGTAESAKSPTFTVTGVAAVPSAPTNLTVQ